MKLTKQQQEFLSRVAGFNERFNEVRMGQSKLPLRHSFWSDAEIKKAPRVQKDWNVPESLVPLYGDWHDVLCLEPASDAILLLNDERQTVHRWRSIAEFETSLFWKPEEPIKPDRASRAKVWLDESLDD